MTTLKNDFRALLGLGLTQADALEILGVHGDAADYAAQIAEARAQTTDDLEIDAAPMVSQSDCGVWVSAWIFISMPHKEFVDMLEPAIAILEDPTP